MPAPFTVTGGANIGWVSASRGLARLAADQDRLTLSIALLGTYSFTPAQVSAIEKRRTIPYLGGSIRIYHCNPDCPARVIFNFFRNPDKVLQGIRCSGFIPVASGREVPLRRGVPARWPVIIGAIAVWNGSLILSVRHVDGPIPIVYPGPFTLVPLTLVLLVCIGALTLPGIQRVILKPGRSIGEIKPFLRLLAFVCALMLAIFSILLASGAFNQLSQ